MRYVRSAFSVIHMVFSSAILAQTPSATEANAAPEQTLRKISIAATRAEEELVDIPATVSVITDADIERELARDIRDLSRYEPGISVGTAVTRFGNAGFNIRGIEANRVAMRIDGVRVNDAFAIGSFADARRNLVDLDMLKSVEILRGPASALYGSDAIGGVVTFVTKDPRDFLEGNEPAFSRIKADYYSDNDGWNLGWTFAGGGDELSSMIVYRRGENAETRNHGHFAPRDNARTAPNPQERSSDSVLSKLVWEPSDVHTLRFSAAFDRDAVATHVYSAQGQGAGSFANIFTVGLRGDDVQERKRFGFDHLIDSPNGAFEQLEWRVNFQETNVGQRSFEERYTFSTGPSSIQFRDRLFEFDQSVLGGEAAARKALSLGPTEHLLIYGIDLTRTRTEQLRDGRQVTQATGAATSNISPDSFPVRDFPNTRTDQFAAFVQDQIALVDGSVLVTPGLRVDYYKLAPESDDIFAADNQGVVVTDLKETSVSPKLGALWHFVDDYSLYASYARGFRAPPYNDVNIGFTNLAFGYTAIANPHLKPETSNGYEVGVRGNFEAAYVALAGFYNDYKDFIASLNFTGVQDGLQVFQSQNLSAAHIYGAEVRAGARFGDFRIRAAGAYARGAGRSVGQTSDQSINSVDPLKGVLGIAYHPHETWNIELVGTTAAKRKHVNQSAPQFVPEGYFVLDMLAQAEFGEHLRLSAGVFNLTDEKYWEWSDVRGLSPTSATLDRTTRPGVNVGASLAVSF